MVAAGEGTSFPVVVPESSEEGISMSDPEPDEEEESTTAVEVAVEAATEGELVVGT